MKNRDPNTNFAQNHSRLSQYSIGISVGVTIAMMFIATAIWQSAQSDQMRRANGELLSVGQLNAARIKAHIETRLNVGTYLKSQWLDKHIGNYDEFRAYTRSALELFQDVQAINWVNPQGVIQWVSPPEGNEAAQGLDLRKLPIPEAILLESEKTGQMQISPPIDLAQGGRGFVAYIPLKTNNVSDGFLNMVFRTEPLIESAIPGYLNNDHQLAITDGDAFVCCTDTTPGLEHPNTVKHLIKIGNREWSVSLTSTTEHNTSIVDEVTLITGLILSVTTGFLIWLTMSRQITLRGNEKRFRLLYHHSPLGISLEDFSVAKKIINRLRRRGVHDLRNHFENHPEDLKAAIVGIRLLDVNEAFVKIFGEDTFQDTIDKEMTGVNWEDNEWREYYLKVCLALADGQISSSFDVMDIGPDGTKTYVSCVNSVPDDHQNDWTEIITTHEDISERIRRGDALRKSEGLLQESMRLARLGYLVWDATQDKCIYCSGIYAEIHGTTADNFARDAAKLDGEFSFTHPDDRERVRQMLADVIRGETIESTYRLLNSDGQVRYVNSIARPLIDERGIVTEIHEVVQDMTRVTEAEGNLQIALVEAQEANRAKSQFLATMSHEFRTPLNAIIGFSDMMRLQYFGPLGAKHYEGYVEDIRNSGEHMLALTNDILDLAAIESGKREFDKQAIDVRATLDECYRHFEHLAQEKGINLLLEAADALPMIFVEKRSIFQIFLNLVSNSIKFTQQGGSITISAVPHGNDLEIKVIDTGLGIPADILPSITEPFIQSRNNPHLAEAGTGLGLSIVKVLTESHDGHMTIESTVGEGTTVTIALPVCSASA